MRGKVRCRAGLGISGFCAPLLSATGQGQAVESRGGTRQDLAGEGEVIGGVREKQLNGG